MKRTLAIFVRFTWLVVNLLCCINTTQESSSNRDSSTHPRLGVAVIDGNRLNPHIKVEKFIGGEHCGASWCGCGISHSSPKRRSDMALAGGTRPLGERDDR